MVGFCAAGMDTVTSTKGTLDNISNYRQYSPLFASSGQPSKADLQTVRDANYKRVIYLAFSNDETAIEAEDRVVKELGMRYVQIPVDFDKPTLTDFQTFLALMRTEPDTKTLLHCQVNLRASTFSLLYRVIELKVPMAEAKQALDSVWLPNETWFRFLKSTLDHYGLSYACDECDWGELEFLDD